MLTNCSQKRPAYNTHLFSLQNCWLGVTVQNVCFSRTGAERTLLSWLLQKDDTLALNALLVDSLPLTKYIFNKISGFKNASRLDLADSTNSLSARRTHRKQPLPLMGSVICSMVLYSESRFSRKQKCLFGWTYQTHDSGTHYPNSAAERQVGSLKPVLSIGAELNGAPRSSVKWSV